jgi:hypothetical protein
VGRIVRLLEYRYAKLYREQVILWHSRQLGLPACHQIAAHVCRDEFIGRLKGGEMKAINARLSKEQPPALPSPLSLEEAS